MVSLNVPLQHVLSNRKKGCHLQLSFTANKGHSVHYGLFIVSRLFWGAGSGCDIFRGVADGRRRLKIYASVRTTFLGSDDSTFCRCDDVTRKDLNKKLCGNSQNFLRQIRKIFLIFRCFYGAIIHRK